MLRPLGAQAGEAGIGAAGRGGAQGACYDVSSTFIAGQGVAGAGNPLGGAGAALRVSAVVPALGRTTAERGLGTVAATTPPVQGSFL